MLRAAPGAGDAEAAPPGHAPRQVSVRHVPAQQLFVKTAAGPVWNRIQSCGTTTATSCPDGQRRSGCGLRCALPGS